MATASIARWYGIAPPLVVAGDYKGDQVVDIQEFNVCRGDFGDSVTAGTGADGNGNGVIDAADDRVGSQNLSGAGAGHDLAAVPAPSALILLIATSLS